MSRVAPSIQLPATLVIGFTGHRALPDEEKSRQLIYGFLKERKAATPGMIYGVSSAAAGGDLLFAESCIQLEIPLRILLPLPKEQFRDDFDAATWQRAEKVLGTAVSVEVTSGNQSRNESYYECGIETVHQSTLLLALWDGESSRGMGGTQEIVTFARSIGRPVVWFHSSTGDVHVFNEEADRELLHDRELDFLNRLPDLGTTPETNSPKDLAWAWFRKIDENASRCAPQVRRMAAIPIVCTAAAAIFSEAGAWTPSVGVWLAVGAAFGILAVFLPGALRLNQRQTLWARTRTAAEVCRSFLAFWGTPVYYEVIGPEIIPELSGMLMSLNLLKMLDGSRSSSSLEEFKERYRKERVAGQIDYFSRHAAQSARETRRYRIAIRICTGPAVLIAACLFVATAGFLRGHVVAGKEWLALGVSILFQIATVAGALLIVNDCDRRQRRYTEIHGWLKEWDTEFDSLRTWPSALRVANRIERALLVELLEWRSLVRDIELPRN